MKITILALVLSLPVVILVVCSDKVETKEFRLDIYDVKCVKTAKRKKPDCVATVLKLLNPIPEAAAAFSPAPMIAASAAANSAAAAARRRRIREMCSNESTAYHDVCIEWKVTEKAEK